MEIVVTIKFLFFSVKFFIIPEILFTDPRYEIMITVYCCVHSIHRDTTVAYKS